MGFREDHPTVVRVHARLWLSIVAAVVALAVIGSVSLASTDAAALECAQAPSSVDGFLTLPDGCDAASATTADQPPAVPPLGETGPAGQPDVTETGPDDAPSTPGGLPEAAPGEAAAPAVVPPAGGPQTAAPAEPATTEGDPSNVAPVAADEPAPVASPAATEPQASTPTQARPQSSAQQVQPGDDAGSKPAAKRKHRSASDREANTYFPPVTIDWLSLTPLAPPAFGSGEATRFPGPLFLLPIYQAASVQYGIPWEVLASINEIETAFGSNLNVSSAGAVGWMQFMPATWAMWGVDANRDGQKNPNDPVDAIFSAARYLRASGAGHDLPRAIFAYNHANWYVEKVLRRATEIGDLPEDLLATLVAAGRTQAGAIRRVTGSPGLFDPDREPKTIGRVLLLDDERLREHVLADERIDVYGCGRQDIAAGIIDRRALETLAFLASRELRPAVTSLRCGHGYYTSAGTVSEHAYGAAIDIASVNGTPVLGHQGEGSVTDETIRALLELRGALRPHQIISLMTFTGASNAFAMNDHDDHIHVGFAPLRNLEESR